MIGECRLCLKQGVELRDSHYIPAAIYRQLRDPKAARPHPFSISEKATVQTSKQLRAHLLCDACEGRVSKLGEDWMIRRMRRQDGRFMLKAMLDSQAPLAAVSDNPTRVYLGSTVPDFDPDAVAYFAASVFWRGALHPWNDDGSVPVRLGKRYAEEFRRYLDGTAEFPFNAVLHVALREGSDLSMVTVPPFGMKTDGFHEYWFCIPGVAFILSVGQEIPLLKRQYCFVRGQGHPISQTPLIEAQLEAIAVRMHGKNMARRL